MKHRLDLLNSLEDYLICSSIKYTTDGIAVAPHLIYTNGMLANAYFFGHSTWGAKYFKQESNNSFWKERWQTILPSWDGKVVVDIGCGPGNVHATLGGSPALIIGVDISINALRMAKSLGYVPLLADAQKLPLKSNFADIVTLNATIHHCNNMAAVLMEAARLVKPGGVLITDLDPQVSARQYRAAGLWFDNVRRHPFREFMRPSQKRSTAEIQMRAATEIHNLNPGDGVTSEFYYRTLTPMGFAVDLYPHNHYVGGEIFEGKTGKAPWYIRVAQILSGITPGRKESAQSIMCVAHLERDSGLA